MSHVPVFEHLESLFVRLNERQREAFNRKFPAFHGPTEREKLTVVELEEMKRWMNQRIRTG